MRFLSYEAGNLPPLLYVSPWKRFVRYELVAAVVLMTASLCALAAANTTMFGALYQQFRDAELSVGYGPLRIAMPLQLWVNDALMCTFFFLVGLQIKYEVLAGHLTSLRTAMLPIIGAIGGMALPAAIFLSVNAIAGGADAGTRVIGWPIPISTDIAFAAGCMGIVRRRVPAGLYVFLITLAIVDDLGAVIVIAATYTEGLAPVYLGAGITLAGIAWLLGRLGVHSAVFFLALGGVVWACFLLSGVHATMAGVLMAFAIPLRSHYPAASFLDRMRELLDHFRTAGNAPRPRLVNDQQQTIVRSVVRECFYVESALQRIMYNLEPFCALFVLPLFAFVNSGIVLDWAHMDTLLVQPVTIGVFLGLLFGKQGGITLACWAAVRSGLARLPEDVRVRQLWALSWIAGIGFTMALFLSELAFVPGGHTPQPFQIVSAETVQQAPHVAEPHPEASRLPDARKAYNEQAKAGIFLASGASASIGVMLLILLSPAIYTRENGNGA